jgi:hypothetical protein
VRTSSGAPRRPRRYSDAVADARPDARPDAVQRATSTSSPSRAAASDDLARPRRQGGERAADVPADVGRRGHRTQTASGPRRLVARQLGGDGLHQQRRPPVRSWTPPTSSGAPDAHGPEQAGDAVASSGSTPTWTTPRWRPRPPGRRPAAGVRPPGARRGR